MRLHSCNRIAVLVLALAVAAPAGAALADEGWTLEQLMRTLGEQRSGEAGFRETKHLSTLKAPLVVEGRLRYASPDLLEKEVLKPAAERYRISGDSVEVYRGDQLRHRMSLAEYPALQGFMHSLLAILTGDLHALRQHFEIALTGTRAQWSLRLVPREPALARRVYDIEVRGGAAQVRHFEIRQRNGDRSVMQITPLT